MITVAFNLLRLVRWHVQNLKLKLSLVAYERRKINLTLNRNFSSNSISRMLDELMKKSGSWFSVSTLCVSIERCQGFHWTRCKRSSVNKTFKKMTGDCAFLHLTIIALLHSAHWSTCLRYTEHFCTVLYGFERFCAVLCGFVRFCAVFGRFCMVCTVFIRFLYGVIRFEWNMETELKRERGGGKN